MFQQVSQMPGSLLQIIKHIDNRFIISLTKLHPLLVLLQFESPFTTVLCWIPFFGDPVSSPFWLHCFICWSTYSSNTLSGKGAWEVNFLSCGISETSHSLFILEWSFGWAVNHLLLVFKAFLAVGLESCSVLKLWCCYDFRSSSRDLILFSGSFCNFFITTVLKFYWMYLSVGLPSFIELDTRWVLFNLEFLLFLC